MVADHLHEAALRHVREQGRTIEMMQRTIDVGGAERKRLQNVCAALERENTELRARLATIERGSNQLRDAVGRAAGVIR